MSDVALVTAIYGDYDTPKPLPVNWDDDVPAYLFTDSHDIAVRAGELGWRAILDEYPTGDKELSPMLRAKFIKTHPLIAAPNAKVSIWIDGSMTITVEHFVGWCLTALGDDDVSMTSHPTRDCIYLEAQVTTALARYGDCDPIRQVDFYRDVIGHPVNWGLLASGASTRRHNAAVESWGKYWWDDCVNWTYQDQLSLPVITRLMELEGKLKWNCNMPWAQWWGISNHEL